ncbi:Unknown (Maco146) [Spodoptera exigua multiple nucleopolyhedrovirus]|nr:Unknown (Maco146) [Spodoptera exigua multiple nucleopolyhedrovirus]CDG72594.1 Unknown (Maco146) [Spodoptera exigua multiple nucleopolyhedrovirus]CDG72731.1 Unknown (Maco146) [Spodoptera exigua multiple nucleopolyhedrovirus]CDG72868.1 Unknown (Maco146) [Spodoptera exigua multiple nucleopolyhedrovirus]CDG73157.1 Unknown (Maco146) [Spodoptera exigua multiple nucleopolyhedrovirus]
MKMNTGTLCLAIDSVALDVRKIHQSVMKARSCMDFEMNLPDLSDIHCNLKVAQYDIDYLINYANKDVDKMDMTVNNMISETITNELEIMLKNFAEQINGDQQYSHIKACQHIFQTNDAFDINNFYLYLEQNKFDYVLTFVNITNSSVLPSSHMFSFLTDKLLFLRRLCNKIYIHIHEVDAVAALIYMQKQQQLPNPPIVFEPPPILYRPHQRQANNPHRQQGIFN